jgi:hypothetical protein
MTLPFAFLNWILCRASVAYGSRDDGVGRVLGLAETRAPARSHRLTARGRYLYTARDRRAGGRQAAADTESHIAAGPDRAYRNGWVTRRARGS